MSWQSKAMVWVIFGMVFVGARAAVDNDWPPSTKIDIPKFWGGPNEPNPGQPAPSRPKQPYQPRYGSSDQKVLRIKADSYGQFTTLAIVNGHDADMMFDTGASANSFDRPHARRLGINIDGLAYTQKNWTANGVTWCATVHLRTLVIGPFVFNNVPADVCTGEMDGNLLGMNLLRQMNMSIKDDILTLSHS